MPNPTSPFSGSVDGVWLIPYRLNQPVTGTEVWIRANPPGLVADVHSEEFDLANRREILSQDGVLHLDRGEIEDGVMLTKHGATAAEWFLRLQNLIRDQRSYESVLLVCAWYDPFRVKIGGLSKRPVHIAGLRSFRVSFPFRQVT